MTSSRFEQKAQIKDLRPCVQGSDTSSVRPENALALKLVREHIRLRAAPSPP